MRRAETAFRCDESLAFGAALEDAKPCAADEAVAACEAHLDIERAEFPIHRVSDIAQEGFVLQLAERSHGTLALVHGAGEPLATGLAEPIVPAHNPARVATMVHDPDHSKYGLATPR